MRVVFIALVCLAAFASAVPTHKAPTPNLENAIECTICKEVVGLIENQVNQNVTEGVLKKALEAACSELEKFVPQAKAVCAIAEADLDQIVQKIYEKYTPEEICKDLSLCDSSTRVAAPVVPVSAPLDSCTTCETIISVLDYALTQNATEAEAKVVIDDVCKLVEKYVPGASVVCALADENIEKIMEYLVKKLDPKEVCTLIGVCSSSFKTGTRKAAAPQDSCDTCKELVGLVEGELKQNSTEEEIKKLVTEACTFIEKYVPGAKAECDLIENNIDAVIDYITKNLSPEEVCTLVGLCSNSKVHSATSIPVPPHRISKAVGALTAPLDNCDTCKELVGFVENELKQNATEEEIKKLVTEACDFIEKYVPGVAAECTLVENNIDAVINYITKNLSPEEVCTLIGLCSNSKIETRLTPTVAKADSCSLCKELIGILESEVKKNSTIAEIKVLVTDACNFVEQYIPQLKAECTLLEDNIEEIIDHIVDGYTPEELCTLIGQCSTMSAEAVRARHPLSRIHA